MPRSPPGALIRNSNSPARTAHLQYGCPTITQHLYPKSPVATPGTPTKSPKNISSQAISCGSSSANEQSRIRQSANINIGEVHKIDATATRPIAPLLLSLCAPFFNVAVASRHVGTPLLLHLSSVAAPPPW